MTSIDIKQNPSEQLPQQLTVALDRASNSSSFQAPSQPQQASESNDFQFTAQ